MKRVVGFLEVPVGSGQRLVHSFLKVEDHVIDNTFTSNETEEWKNHPEWTLQNLQNKKYNDGDPADPKNGVDPKSSVIGKYVHKHFLSSKKK